MNKMVLKQFVKIKKVGLTVFLLFCLIFYENVFAQKKWTRDYVEIIWEPQNDYIFIAAVAYDYEFAPNSAHGYLESCRFEIGSSKKTFFKLMEINVERQLKSDKTTLYLSDKLNDTKIELLHNVDNVAVGSLWPEKQRLKLIIRNYHEEAILGLGWHIHKNVRKVAIRISGTWHVDPPFKSESFQNIFYYLTKPDVSAMKSKRPDVNTNVVEKESVKVFKDSEAIFIKGADLGANIKVYTLSYVEIKSVISNKDLVKIKLPAKQIYLVHVGSSRYMVAL